jgi:hypothetical protein
MKGGFIFVIVQVVTFAHLATSKPSLSSAKGNLKYVDPLIGTDSNFTKSEYGGMIPSTGKARSKFCFLGGFIMTYT